MWQERCGEEVQRWSAEVERRRGAARVQRWSEVCGVGSSGGWRMDGVDMAGGRVVAAWGGEEV